MIFVSHHFACLGIKAALLSMKSLLLLINQIDALLFITINNAKRHDRNQKDSFFPIRLNPRHFEKKPQMTRLISSCFLRRQLVWKIRLLLASGWAFFFP